MESSPKSPRNVVLQTLRESFPAFASFQPLAIGIHEAVNARLPDLVAAELKTALRIHTKSTRYLKSMATAKHRVDLDGNPAGDITDEQRAHAAELLKERFRKDRERRDAEDAVRKAQEAEQRKQEKLQQLAARFSKR
ncbi:MAG TPA: ProQ/FINO family protein [Rhodocyclaceae bacterium]